MPTCRELNAALVDASNTARDDGKPWFVLVRERCGLLIAPTRMSYDGVVYRVTPEGEIWCRPREVQIGKVVNGAVEPTEAPHNVLQGPWPMLGGQPRG